MANSIIKLPEGGRLTAEDIRKKYAKNPYVVSGGRNTWGDYLDKNFAFGKNTNVRNSIVNASKQTGVSPSLLFSSAMEEGMTAAINDPNSVSPYYDKWASKNGDTANQYKVDGFLNYGLDTFGDKGVADKLIQKGY